MIRYSNKPNNFSPLPVGTYDLRIESVAVKPKNENDQLVVKAVVVGGPSDGRSVTDWFTLSEAAMWRVGNLVEATGVAATVVGEDAQGNPAYEFDENDLVGLCYRVDVTIREYTKDGQKRQTNDFKNFAPSDVNGGAEEEEPEPEPAPAPAPVQRRQPPQAAGGGVARRPRGAA